MATSKSKIALSINKDTIKYFDELINIDIVRRPSDLGFQDSDKMMIRPRPPLEFISTPTTTTQNCSNIFFYTDKIGVTRAYRVRNTTTDSTRSHNIEYSVVTIAGTFVSFGTWTLITTLVAGLNATTNYQFDVVRVPSYFTIEPTLYNVPVTGTIVDRVSKNAGDPLGASAIGKVLMIQSGIYEGTYAIISGYDTVNSEYILQGSGAIVPFVSGIGYRIYDNIADNLMLYSSELGDRYIDGIIDRGDIRETMTRSLRNALIIDSGEFVKKQIFFNNKRWVFKGTTIFASSGLPGNPFFYTFANAYTVSSKEITGITVYKNRLIVYGRTFVYAIDANFRIEKLSDYYGVRDSSIVETGDDMYFISTEGKIISMNEATSGSLYVKNIADIASLYTKDFIADTFAGADSSSIYFGGRRTSGNFNGAMYILVYNLIYKFWSVYRCPAISGITTFNGVAFFRDAIIAGHRAFADKVFANTFFATTENYASTVGLTTPPSIASTNYLQSVSTRYLEGKDIFNERKRITSVKIWLENVTSRNWLQMRTAVYSDKRASYLVDRVIQNEQVMQSTTPLGEGETGLELTGGSDIIALNTAVPRLHVEKIGADFANLWRVTFNNIAETGFYLNYFEIELEEETKDTFITPSQVK